MNAKPKILLASLISPLAVLIIPLLLNIYSMVTDQPSLDPTPDNAPYRAMLIFNVLLVIAYPILSLFMLITSYTLQSLKILSFTSIIIISALSSLVIGIYFTLQSAFGIKDRIFSFLIFGFGSFVCFALGAICWWYIANRGHNKSFKLVRSLTLTHGTPRKRGAP
jgi:hypothetical protein